MPFVNERWLGGMLTNFATISSRVGKLREYEAMERAGDFEAMPKKEGLRHRRELEKLRRNLGGIRDLDRLPDAVFVIDTKKEHIAVTEANKLVMPIVAVVDTNCDPDVITYVIPGNDDAIRSGALMCRVMAEAVIEGRWVAEHQPAPARPAAGGRDRSAPAPAAPRAPVRLRHRPSRRPTPEAAADRPEAATAAAGGPPTPRCRRGARRGRRHRAPTRPRRPPPPTEAGPAEPAATEPSHRRAATDAAARTDES